MSAAAGLCTFRVGGACYALPASDVAEIVRRPEITPVPLAPPGIRGLLNLRGRILPVVDAKLALGHAPGGALPSYVLVIGAGDDAAGLLVDELGDVIEDGEGAFHPPVRAAASHATDAVRGVVASQELIVALDLGRVLERVLAGPAGAAPSGAGGASTGDGAP